MATLSFAKIQAAAVRAPVQSQNAGCASLLLALAPAAALFQLVILCGPLCKSMERKRKIEREGGAQGAGVRCLHGLCLCISAFLAGGPTFVLSLSVFVYVCVCVCVCH